MTALPDIPFTPRYAGFWLRLVAWLIDGAILAFFGWILGQVFGVSTVEATPERFAVAYHLPGIVWMIAGWIYYAGFETSGFQGTPGKLILGLAVTDRTGDRPDFGKASIRYWGKILSSLIFMLGYVMAAFTARKQALHDLMAGCLVIKR